MPYSQEPPALRALKGVAPGKDSGGRPIEESPEYARKAPKRPAELDNYAGQMWDDVCATLASVDLLREIDEYGLRLLCETYSRWRTSVDRRKSEGLTSLNGQGIEQKAPWIAIEEKSSDQVRFLLREFGLTLSSEGQIGISGNAKEQEFNPFAASS